MIEKWHDWDERWYLTADTEEEAEQTLKAIELLWDVLFEENRFSDVFYIIRKKEWYNVYQSCRTGIYMVINHRYQTIKFFDTMVEINEVENHE